MIRPITFALFVSPLAAQQFTEEPDLIPGPVLWSEAAIVLDANEDGLPDVLFVNAQGYAMPGDFGAPSADPLPPTLVVHQGFQGGLPVFADQTAQYFPASFEIHGKTAAVGDYDADGHEDLAFAVAFGDQQRLFRKNSLANTYDDETFRLPPLVMNSFGVSTADFDDDGDLDLVFCDAGPLSFGLPGGTARLCLNDGNGVFSDDSARLNAIPKIGAQNAKVVDIEGDLDLDIVIDGKSGTTQVYFNDGAANFTLDTLIVPQATGSMTWGSYETEWADLDNDDDIDAMYMNFALSAPGVVLADSPLQNLLAETGQLRLVADSSQMVGDNGQDENDFALYDADNDGDLDVLVSVLTPDVEEKLFLNSGTFGPGFMTQVPGAFTNFDDSSLDLGLADFDFDGDQDIVTAQGENPFGAEDFQNRYYTNSGPADTTAPRVPRVTTLASSISFAELQAGPVLRAWVQDSVVDDNSPYAEAALGWTVDQGGQMTPGSMPMDYVGGGLHRAELVLPTTPSLLGATVDVQVTAMDGAGNVGTSSQQSFFVCGVESTYCTAKANSQGCLPAVGWSGSPSAADPTPFTITADMVLNNKNGLLFYGYQGPSNLPFLGGILCLAPPLRRLSIQNSGGNPPPNDCSGQFSFDFNAQVQSGVDPLLVSGARINAQWWSRDPAQADGTGAGLTDAIEFWICD